MSTKTTIKRIALVAVSALGLGMVSTVAANAAVTPTSITVGTVPTATQVGSAVTVPVTVNYSTGYTAGGSDTYTVNVKVTSAPAGSAFNALATQGIDNAGSGATSFASGVYARGAGNQFAAQTTVTLPSANKGILASATTVSDKLTIGYVFTSGPVTAGTTGLGFNVNITPDVPGSYTVLVSTTGDATPAAYTGASGQVATTYTFSTGNAVASASIAAVTGSSTTGSDVGQLFKVTLKDSAGAAAGLASGQTLTITGSSSSEKLTALSTSNNTFTGATSNGASADAALVMTSSNFIGGVGYFVYKNATAQTGEVLTLTGSGSLSSSITTTALAVVKTMASDAGSDITFSDGTATRPGSGHTAYAAGTPGTITASTSATSHSVVVTFATGVTADSSFDVKVTDTSGKITGIVGQVYNVVLPVTYDSTTTAQKATLTISGTLSTAGNAFTALIKDSAGTWGTTADDGVTVTSATTDSTSFRPLGNSSTLGNTKTLFQTIGGTTTIWATLYDQFGAAMASRAVTASVTGRNATTSAANLVTDASGRVSYSVVDAGTATTANTQDTVTFTSASTTSVSSVVTINYGASTASSITCLTGNEDDTATLKTYRDISAGDGAQAGAASLCTITVKDANGAVLQGVPVTVKTSSDGAAVVSTSATLYTSSTGTVSPSVYAWTAGTKTFTITAGAVTKSVTVNYIQKTNTEVRTISAVADGNKITVTAKDRFGNLVPGVKLYATRTGDGLFGGGNNTANATTAGYASGTTPQPANLGTAEFIFNGGSNESVVTIQVASAADTPDPEYGQVSSGAGKICASAGCTDTALTAYVAGTDYTAEVGVGASLSPAGVGSVTVTVPASTQTVDAIDAANEATDAANAATDAANAAAEAADAATAAAQDAQAAVADLAAQVATLIAGIKAQITALTNLVIKIQKKVKA